MQPRQVYVFSPISGKEDKMAHLMYWEVKSFHVLKNSSDIILQIYNSILDIKHTPVIYFNKSIQILYYQNKKMSEY